MRRVLPLALLAAACATARASRQDADALACGRGDSAACASRGLRALTGEGVPRDERDAAAWLMAACERGYGQSCADLGALYAAGRGVRQDDGRACELGLAEACTRAGRPVPALARTPQVTLGPGPGTERALPPDPADLQRALDYAEFYVAASDHGPLGLSRQALEADPPAPWRDVQLVRPLVELRSPAVARCLPVYRYPSGWESSLAVLSFDLDGDGRASRPTVQCAEASEVADGCVRGVVASWEFPRPLTGGRMWFQVRGAGPLVAVPARAGSGAAWATAGWRKPTAKVPDCIVRAIRIPPAFEAVSGRVLVRYKVSAQGRASDFLMLEPAPIPLGRAFRDAVYSCEFVPGADPQGNPATVWVIQPVRFVAR